LEDAIYKEMIAFRRRPENIFTGSPQRLQALMMAMASGFGSPQP
jgi:hypothetical protein